MEGTVYFAFFGHYHNNPSVQQFGLLINIQLTIFKKSIENINQYFCSKKRENYFKALEMTMTFVAVKMNQAMQLIIEPNLLHMID